MRTTEDAVTCLEEGGGASNRLDALVSVARALDRHLVASFAAKLPANLSDALQLAGE